MAAASNAAPSHATPVQPQPLYLPPRPPALAVHATYRHTRGRLLIVGDVHGCVRELASLVAQADLDPSRGDQVLLAGDLVAKGPSSSAVIRLARARGWIAVLGNHDQFLLRCAWRAGRMDGREYEREEDLPGNWTPEEVARCDVHSDVYRRTYYARMPGFHSAARRGCAHDAIAAELTDEELDWLASLPLTITLEPYGWVCVHAGLAPDLPLEQQHPFHMLTMRNLVADTPPPLPEEGDAGCAARSLRPSESLKEGEAWSMHLSAEEATAAVRQRTQASASGDAASASTATAAAASSALSAAAPSAPRRIVFGHDAMRGFQYPNPLRLGLDTACCNGKFLTGLLLPDERVLHVRAEQVYSKPKSEGDTTRSPPQPSGTRLAPELLTEPSIARPSEFPAPAAPSGGKDKQER